jgi:phenylacetic acid degradation operon negative regulatory protein
MGHIDTGRHYDEVIDSTFGIVEDAPDAPGPARGPSARAYLMMVLGEYVLADPAETAEPAEAAWTQTILDALGMVGFGPKAVRKALTRTAAAGLLVAHRAGRRTRWHLTPRGHDYLLAAKGRLFATGPERDWDGDWLLLLTSVRERDRNLRHRLRADLGWAGFGSLGPGVWISPHPTHAAEARQVLDALGEPIHATLLHARLDDPEERHALVTQAWDVAELDKDYRAFVDRFAAADPCSPGETLAELAHLVYEWRRLLLADPGLPPTLLPADWSGEQARRLMLARHTGWLAIAQTWWQSAEATHGPSQDG